MFVQHHDNGRRPPATIDRQLIALDRKPFRHPTGLRVRGLFQPVGRVETQCSARLKRDAQGMQRATLHVAGFKVANRTKFYHDLV